MSLNPALSLKAAGLQQLCDPTGVELDGLRIDVVTNYTGRCLLYVHVDCMHFITNKV